MNTLIPPSRPTGLRRHLAWPLIAMAIVVTLAAAALGGCAGGPHYRPGPRPTLEAPHVDPRPDLPGLPVTPGHALYNAELFLRANFPCDRPWVLRSVPFTGTLLGVTRYDAPGWLMGDRPPDGALVIEVRDDLEGWQQREVLCHEFAHVLTWDFPESPHGAVWSAAYGMIYRGVRGEK